MNEVVVSVIIPAYNSAGTIARALDSVFAQSYTKYEVIIVDDGSTDDLATALAPYGGRVRLIRQANAGASAARNTGARESRGRYLAFLDADDFWHMRKLELQTAAFVERPEISYCWTGSLFWNDGMTDPSRLPLNGDCAARYSSDFTEIFARPYIGTPAVMFNREDFEKLGGFRHDLRSAEDVDLWLRAAYGRVIAHIPAPLFYVVRLPGSLTARLNDSTYRDNIRVLDDFCAAHPEFERSHARLVSGMRGDVYENWGSNALVGGRLGEARHLLRQALRNRTTFRSVHLFGKTMLRGGLFASRS